MAKILIVDDSSTVRDEVAGFLKNAGLDVKSVARIVGLNVDAAQQPAQVPPQPPQAQQQPARRGMHQIASLTAQRRRPTSTARLMAGTGLEGALLQSRRQRLGRERQWLNQAK